MAFRLWLLSCLASTASSLVQGRKTCTWLFQVSTFQQDPLISEFPIWSFWLLDEDIANRFIEWSELCIHRLGLGALPPAPYACLLSCSKDRAPFLTMQIAFSTGRAAEQPAFAHHFVLSLGSDSVFIPWFLTSRSH